MRGTQNYFTPWSASVPADDDAGVNPYCGITLLLSNVRPARSCYAKTWIAIIATLSAHFNAVAARFGRH